MLQLGRQNLVAERFNRNFIDAAQFSWNVLMKHYYIEV